MLQNVMRRMWKRRATLCDQRGVSLAESLIAVAVVGIALTALLATLSTGSLAVQRTDKRVIAENLARTQMEYAKGQDYSGSYQKIAEPDGYSIEIVLSAVNGRDQNDIQKITVTVSYNDNTLDVEDFKVNR